MSSKARFFTIIPVESVIFSKESPRAGGGVHYIDEPADWDWP